MKMQKIALACLLALAATSASAIEPKNQVTPMTVNAGTRADFEAVVVEVKNEMQQGGRFEFINKAERNDIDDAFRRMGLLFENHDKVAEMNKTDQVAMFNQQEVVNAILKNRDSDRVICKRIRKTGTNLGTTECITYGERERQRMDSMAELGRIQNGGPSSTR
jgi:hypothetical protein